MLWILGIFAAAAILVLLTSYICFRMAFHARPDPGKDEEYPIPPGKVYAPHRPVMMEWMDKTRQLPCREFSITSFDGLKLYGKYYECQPGAPIELMLHGYRGLAERDLCGGVQRCFRLGRNALLVDQRACGKSQGKVITFGIRERRDCLDWVQLLIREFGSDVKIILTGISMGASTVLMASAMELPKNVIGIIADCGFTSPKAIIKKVIRQMKLPADLAYPFVKLGARLYGGFDLEERSPIKSMRHCRLPVIFYHGDNDQYVPHHMSVENYEACTAPKKLVITPGAGHGLCFIQDKEAYLKDLVAFCEENDLPVVDNGTSML